LILFWISFAVRMLLRRRARTGITFAAITIGIAILTFLGSIMIGVNDAMVANSISLYTGNMLIRSPDPWKLLAQWRSRRDLPSQVSAVLPRAMVPAMLVTRSGAVPVQLVGVLPQNEERVAAVPRRIEKGRYLSASPAYREVLLGNKAAETLRINPGDTLSLRLAHGNSYPARVTGVFRTGIDRFDEGVAYAPLDQLKALDVVNLKAEVALFFREGLGSEAGKRLISRFLSEGEKATPWEEVLPELAQLLRLNVVSMLIVIVLVVTLMASGVSNTVLVSVMDRYRTFGVLKALGVTPGEVIRLILFETALICLVAGLVGIFVAGVPFRFSSGGWVSIWAC
jgi:putative ABC transport system permease protein